MLASLPLGDRLTFVAGNIPAVPHDAQYSQTISSELYPTFQSPRSIYSVNCPAQELIEEPGVPVVKKERKPKTKLSNAEKMNLYKLRVIDPLKNETTKKHFSSKKPVIRRKKKPKTEKPIVKTKLKITLAKSPPVITEPPATKKPKKKRKKSTKKRVKGKKLTSTKSLINKKSKKSVNKPSKMVDNRAKSLKSLIKPPHKPTKHAKLDTGIAKKRVKKVISQVDTSKPKDSWKSLLLALSVKPKPKRSYLSIPVRKVPVVSKRTRIAMDTVARVPINFTVEAGKAQCKKENRVN
ncbi:hypothetical protein PCE1_003037 [Barthelona sp. PCE]